MKITVGAISIGLLLTAASESALAASVLAREGIVAAGRAFALQACTSCHVVAPEQPPPINPPVASAPDFTAVANAKTTSATGLYAFLVTTHKTMPNIMLSDETREDVIAYILSLRTRD